VLEGRQETRRRSHGVAEASQSLDARRIAREQCGMAASTAVGLNAAKHSLLVFAENFEQAARNYEKSFEAVRSSGSKFLDCTAVRISGAQSPKCPSCPMVSAR
jgi:hypothetical protein